MLIISFVYCLIEEAEICPCPLDVFLYLVPKILILKEPMPLAVEVRTQRMINRFFGGAFFLSCFDRGLDDKLLPPYLISVSRAIQVSVPLVGVERQVVQK